MAALIATGNSQQESAAGLTARQRGLLLLPALLAIAIFLVLPLGFILVYSFLTKGTYGGVVWEFSLAAYEQFLFERDLFTDELVFHASYLQIYGRSVLQALVATIACLAIGFPTAYYIATRPAAQRNMWVFLITVPYWVNLLIRTVSMLFIIRDEGPLNSILLGIGLISEPIRLAYTDFAIGLGLVYSYLPFMVLPIYAAIERFDFRLVEAGHDLYADRWTILRQIIVPLTRPGIVAGSLLVFIPSLGSFIAPDLLGGGKNLMIGNTIALQFQSSRNWPFGSAAAVILLTLVLIVLVLFARRAQQAAAEQGRQ
ncbi:spermidine/putrescine transport system permease protein [Dongia mobilis]|uniref:Spermidine/putrescine transport system permease protein n=1 Tax=Dongia mobilis TaxID=578943 RepID=A0A4R6WVJ2_9PROT|nr:ABC transporter permease [Dongia mobilis]TDQ83336.1 spermidine/putrescine transport system permease protein [Dongia mobilis]